MEINYAFFCDAATTDSSGKVNVLGICDGLYSKIFPFTCPQITFVVSIKAHRLEVGQHKIVINFADQDGNNIVPPINGTFEIFKDRTGCSLILNIQRINFNNPGIYMADILIDNNHLKTVDFNMLKMQ